MSGVGFEGKSGKCEKNIQKYYRVLLQLGSRRYIIRSGQVFAIFRTAEIP